MTVVGTVELGSLEVRFTEVSVPAGVTKVTVPVEETPPITDVGAKVKLWIVGGLTVSDAVWLEAARCAVIVAVIVEPTGVVLTVNFVEMYPAGTVIVAGTVTPPLLDERLITVSYTGSISFIVTVPVDGAPPASEVGDRLKPTTVFDGFTVISARMTTAP
jgi:hypothetical protein